jgi:hypothetical protein
MMLYLLFYCKWYFIASGHVGDPSIRCRTNGPIAAWGISGIRMEKRLEPSEKKNGAIPSARLIELLTFRPFRDIMGAYRKPRLSEIRERHSQQRFGGTSSC